MRLITFDEYSVGTTNPIYDFDDTSIFFYGGIRADFGNPTSPSIAGSSSSFFPPVHAFMSVSVSSISFDVGYLDDLGSTRVNFYNDDGLLVSSQQNTSLGFQSFSFNDPSGISSFTVTLVAEEGAGFGVDNVRVGTALLHKAPDVRGSPFPGRIHATVSVTGMPSAV
jgi:hypothetical protein